MKVKLDELEFEWDKGNLNKIHLKHEIVKSEAESVFLDENSFIILDERHSVVEDRFIIIGRSEESRVLFIVFTMRRKKVRVISARRMHRKEVDKYAKIKKNTQI